MSRAEHRIELSQLERQVINALQRGLPLCPRPFRELAESLGVDEQTIVDTVDHLLGTGVATRFGPMFDVEKMGGRFCLCAVAAGDNWPEVAAIINQHDAVAHNYLRDHDFNLWFVIAAESQRQLDQVIATLERETGLAILALPKLKEYAIRLYLEA
jgi:DNA-binding Lrp family transcriptional regulator